MCATVVIFEVLADFKLAGIEDWLNSGMFCCKNAKYSEERKRQKVGATLEHGTGDFLVGLIAYHGHFWLVCLKYQRVHFRAAVGVLEKK